MQYFGTLETFEQCDPSLRTIYQLPACKVCIICFDELCIPSFLPRWIVGKGEAFLPLSHHVEHDKAYWESGTPVEVVNGVNGLIREVVVEPRALPLVKVLDPVCLPFYQF